MEVGATKRLKSSQSDAPVPKPEAVSLNLLFMHRLMGRPFPLILAFFYLALVEMGRPFWSLLPEM